MALAVDRLVHRDEDGRLVSRSSIYTTGAMKLREVREEVKKIKQEKRGERRQTKDTSADR